MRKFMKRTGCAVVALAMCAGLMQSVQSTLSVSAADVIFQAECEDLELSGGGSPTVWTDVYGALSSGYSGEGFVYLTGETLSFTVEAPEEGMYEILFDYAQILDTDGRMQTISINGTDYTFVMPYSDTFQELDIGRYRLQEGENTIEIKPVYGYGCYDTITIQTAESVDLTVSSDTCDPDATSETKSLMNYLTSVYGEHIISGQQEIYGGGHDGNYEQEFEYLYDLSGEYPAIRGFDFMNYNPLYGWEDGTTERIIEWVNERGGIATASWHINLPKDFDSYEIGDTLDWTDCSYGVNSTFSVENAVVDGTKENQYLDTIIEDLAEQLTILQDNNVPIILRPFHEAEGNGGLDGSGAWFWWAQDGAEAYKALWQYFYDALTEDYEFYNIIWEQNLYAWSDDSAQWYVGDDYVDIVGYDKYNTTYNRHDGLTSGPNEDAESKIFYSLVDYVDGNKMVSMPENDTVPSLTNLQIEEAGWLYFCIWYDNDGDSNFVSSDSYQNADTLKEMYQSDYCITLSELPADLYNNSGYTTTTTVTDETTESTETETTTLGVETTDTDITSDTDSTESIISSDTTSDTVSTEDSTTISETTTESDVSETTEETTTETTESETTATSDGNVTGDVMCGDINLDGNVTLADVVLLNKSIAGSVDLSTDAIANSDCDGSGVLGAEDALVLLRFLVQLVDTLPYTGQVKALLLDP